RQRVRLWADGGRTFSRAADTSAEERYRSPTFNTVAQSERRGGKITPHATEQRRRSGRAGGRGAMDFTIPPEVEQFRQEVAAFAAREWPEELRRQAAAHGEEVYQQERAFRRKLGERGWLSLSWPKQYGGQEPTPLESYVFHQEMSYRGAPLAGTATGIVAPTLMHFGNEEQKARFLPRIAAGDVEFCLGYSEPDAGSDLASLQVRAEEDGDFFVVNGIKRWTSGAHRSEFC